MDNKNILSLAKFAYNEVKARDFRDRIKPLEPWMTEFILNFYSLIKALEIENCAKLCERLKEEDQNVSVGECIDAIRATGEQI